MSVDPTSIAYVCVVDTTGAPLTVCVAKTVWVQHQPDAVLSQMNPTSNTAYTALPSTTFARIISIEASITWLTTQPDLEVLVTIDGQTLKYAIAAPVSTTKYYPVVNADKDENSGVLGLTDYAPYKTFMLEGQSVKVEGRSIWGVTQPTSLDVRVKWAKRVIA